MTKNNYDATTNFHIKLPQVHSRKDNYVYLKGGRKVFDAFGGAVLISLGYGNKRVIKLFS